MHLHVKSEMTCLASLAVLLLPTLQAVRDDHDGFRGRAGLVVDADEVMHPSQTWRHHWAEASAKSFRIAESKAESNDSASKVIKGLDLEKDFLKSESGEIASIGENNYTKELLQVQSKCDVRSRHATSVNGSAGSSATSGDGIQAKDVNMGAQPAKGSATTLPKGNEGNQAKPTNDNTKPGHNAQPSKNNKDTSTPSDIKGAATVSKNKSHSKDMAKTEPEGTLFSVKVSTLAHGLSIITCLSVLLQTAVILVKAFLFPLDLNPQDSEKSLGADDSNRWRVVHVGGLLLLYIKVGSVVVPSGQVPLMKHLGMNLFDYNVLLGVRSIPGLFGALGGPGLQQRYGAAYSLLVMGLLYAGACVIQAIAIWIGSYGALVVATLIIEGSQGVVTAIIATVCAQLVKGEEQSHAVAIISVYALLGQATPLITIPWLIDYAGLSFVAGFTTFLGGTLGALSSYAFSRVTEGHVGESIAEDDLNEVERVGLFSPNVWGRGQALFLMVALSLINGVAMTLGENITDILAENFMMDKERVGLMTFVGLCACVVAQGIAGLFDTTGYRPVAIGIAALSLIIAIVLATIHRFPGTCVISWGVGYSFNLNASLSSFALIVPPEHLSLTMGLATASKYIGLMIIPMLYGYYAQNRGKGTELQMQGKGNPGFICMCVLLFVAGAVLLGVSTYNCKKDGGSLFGTSKYGERDTGTTGAASSQDAADQPDERGENAAASTAASSSSQ